MRSRAASVTGEQTLLCPTRDEANQFCTIAHRWRIAADAQLDRTALMPSCKPIPMPAWSTCASL
jgi:hypothetical protein